MCESFGQVQTRQVIESCEFSSHVEWVSRVAHIATF